VAWEDLVWSLLTGLYYEVLVNWYCHLTLVLGLDIRAYV